MYIVNEFLDNVWKSYWCVDSEQEARDVIDTLKIGRLYFTYNIEHPDGYVIDVFKPPKNSKKIIKDIIKNYLLDV